jgi:hypothetical protein
MRSLRCALWVLVALLLVARPAVAEPLDQSTHEMVDAAHQLRVSLEKLLPFHERELAITTDIAAKRRELFTRGIVSQRDVEQAEQAQAAAQTKVDVTRAQIGQADALIDEVTASLALRRLTPLPTPTPQEGEGAGTRFTYYAGRGEWSLAQLPKLERFFAGRFGRPLPVSALGQTMVHDRLGFDHRNALDVAVHPDSVEGRALIAYLESASISFIAFRGAVPGAATGAHIHVGPASQRLAHVNPVTPVGRRDR